MKITVKRFEFGSSWTIGKMYIDDAYLCYTLEDKVREIPGVPVEEWKVKDETAIPCGTYPVTIDKSMRWNKDMLHILTVKGFVGVRVHAGNTDKDTSGCILVGEKWAGTDFISNCKPVLDQLFELVRHCLDNKEEVWLTIG